MNALSVIAVCHNRSDSPRIDNFLKSINWQVSRTYELIIVTWNNGEYEQSRIEALGRKYRAAIIDAKIESEHLPLSKLYNYGIRNTSGHMIATTDIDMIWHPDLSRIIELNLTDNSRKILTVACYKLGKDVNFKDVNDYRKRYTDIIRGEHYYPTAPGGVQCATRDTWYKLRGYDERMALWGEEDSDLLGRAVRSGSPHTTIKDAIVMHQKHPRPTSRTLLWNENKRLKYENRDQNLTVVNDESWGII